MPGNSSETSARIARREYRRVVSAAVGALRSAEVNNSFAAITLEEVVDQAIELIEGDPGAGTTKPNKLLRADTIKRDLDNAIEGIRATDPDLFRVRNANEDVNTDLDGTEAS